MSDLLTRDFEAHAREIYERASESLFQLLETTCEGAIVVDTDGRVIWINEKYPSFLSRNS